VFSGVKLYNFAIFGLFTYAKLTIMRPHN